MAIRGAESGGIITATGWLATAPAIQPDRNPLDPLARHAIIFGCRGEVADAQLQDPAKIVDCTPRNGSAPRTIIVLIRVKPIPTIKSTSNHSTRERGSDLATRAII